MAASWKKCQHLFFCNKSMSRWYLYHTVEKNGTSVFCRLKKAKNIFCSENSLHFHCIFTNNSLTISQQEIDGPLQQLWGFILISLFHIFMLTDHMFYYWHIASTSRDFIEEIWRSQEAWTKLYFTVNLERQVFDQIKRLQRKKHVVGSLSHPRYNYCD